MCARINFGVQIKNNDNFMQASRKKVENKRMNKRSVSTLRNDSNKIMNGHEREKNVKSQNAALKWSKFGNQATLINTISSAR